MPIQILQPEFIGPIYIGTWAGKPSAAGNAGKKIIVTDFLNSEWKSNGTNWVPANGRAVVYAPDTTGITATNLTVLPVAGIPGWRMPEDLSLTPGIRVEGSSAVSVANPSSALGRPLLIGNEASNAIIAFHNYVSVSTEKDILGVCPRMADGTWRMAGQNTVPPNDGTGAGLTFISNAQMLDSPLRLYYRSPTASEVLTVHNFVLAIRFG